MYSIKVQVVQIEYEATFRKIFPVLKEKLGAVRTENLLIRLFQKLDDAALSVFLGVMERLSKETKDKILALCLNTYSDRICEYLAMMLKKHPYGEFLKTGRIVVVQESGIMDLWLGQVQVDYKGLVKKKVSGKMGQLASLFVGEKLEKLALELLWKEESKKMLLGLMQDALRKYGFTMELTDIQIRKEPEESEHCIEAESQLALTDEMEEEMLDALTGYLRKLTSEKECPGCAEKTENSSCVI